MDDIISGSYWTQAYCEKEKLDYEEQNESFSTCCKLPSMRTAAKRSHCIFTAIQSTVSLKKSSCKT